MAELPRGMQSLGTDAGAVGRSQGGLCKAWNSAGNMTSWKRNPSGRPETSRSKFLVCFKTSVSRKPAVSWRGDKRQHCPARVAGPRVTRGTPQRVRLRPPVITSCLRWTQCSLLIIYTSPSASEFAERSPVSHPGPPSRRLRRAVFGLGVTDDASERSAALPEVA